MQNMPAEKMQPQPFFYDFESLHSEINGDKDIDHQAFDIISLGLANNAILTHIETAGDDGTDLVELCAEIIKTHIKEQIYDKEKPHLSDVVQPLLDSLSNRILSIENDVRQNKLYKGETNFVNVYYAVIDTAVKQIVDSFEVLGVTPTKRHEKDTLNADVVISVKSMIGNDEWFFEGKSRTLYNTKINNKPIGALDGFAPVVSNLLTVVILCEHLNERLKHREKVARDNKAISVKAYKIAEILDRHIDDCYQYALEFVEFVEYSGGEGEETMQVLRQSIQNEFNCSAMTSQQIINLIKEGC